MEEESECETTKATVDVGEVLPCKKCFIFRIFDMGFYQYIISPLILFI